MPQSYPPHDIIVVYVGGENAMQFMYVNKWTDPALVLDPGAHMIDSFHQYNSIGFSSFLPSPPEREGVFLCALFMFYWYFYNSWRINRTAKIPPKGTVWIEDAEI